MRSRWSEGSQCVGVWNTQGYSAQFRGLVENNNREKLDACRVHGVVAGGYTL